VKLTLDRFKTHTSKTLELPDTGLILLDGQSGAGKSTILKAFLYAAYGAVAKPVSWNETSCSVSWELKGQTITRGKGKGNISFNGLTGDSAQASLCSFLGMSEQEFIASSYIAQKNDNSLLTLTPAEQLRFIERLAFGEQSPDLFKKKIQETANSLSQSISSLESKIAGLHELTEQYSSQPTTDFSSYITAKEELSGLKDSLKQLKASKISLQEEALALTKEHSARIKLISEMQHIKQKAQDLKDLEANFANRAGTEQIESPENIQQQVKFLELALNLVKDNNLLSGLDAKRQEANLELLCTRETAKELFSKYLQAQHELLGSDRTTEELSSSYSRFIQENL
jgi:DNA repair exonuclease SbcCD ATPase subunit